MNFEDNPKAFLLLIVQTISVVLIWMIFHVLIGIYFELGFFENKPGWKNYLYYLFLLFTLIMLIRYLRKKWI